MCGLRSLFCENSDDDIAGSQKSGANCTLAAGVRYLSSEKTSEKTAVGKFKERA